MPAMLPSSSGCSTSMRAYRYTRRAFSGAYGICSIKNMFSMGVVSNIAAFFSNEQNDIGLPAHTLVLTISYHIRAKKTTPCARSAKGDVY